jgi:AAT family amino acid transporter/D-serine/D-alanine/glycine transporter
VVNFVVVTAIISACNTGVFATSRVLRGLALAGQAPAAIAKINGRGVPVNALTVSVLSMLLGVGLNYIAPKQVFSIIMRADAALMLWIWLTIVWSHMNYRRRENINPREVAFGLRGSPYSNLFVMTFIAFICAFNFLDLTSLAIFALSLAWFGALGLLYVWIKRRRPASS